MTERQNHRQYIEKTMKHLEDWEEYLLQREQTFERNRSNMQVQYDRYTKYQELQKQAERSITAGPWQEVAQTTLLISLLDGYEEHAQGIQAKLLTRLHSDTKQVCQKQQVKNRQNKAILSSPNDEDSANRCRPNSTTSVQSYESMEKC